MVINYPSRKPAPSRLPAGAGSGSSLRSFNYKGHDFLCGRPVKNVLLTKPLSGAPFVTLHLDLTARVVGEIGRFRDGELIDVRLTEIVKCPGGLPRIACKLFVPPKKP
jgi:hypothetical protein